MADDTLSISEELLLLAMDDEKGKLVSPSMGGLAYTQAGAVLFELILMGKIEIEDDKIVTWPVQPMGDPIFDMAIARFAKKNAVKKLGYWIGRLSKDSRKIKQILIEKLISLGALRKEERQFLWTFKYNRYPTDDSRIEDRIRMRVFEGLFGEGTIDSRDYVLLTLIGTAKLEKVVFPEDQAKEAKKLIADLKRDDAIGSAISSAIVRLEAAMTAAIVASVAASAAGS
jgi:golgi phosphoprotein 3